MYRQGDVMLIPVDAVPQGCKTVEARGGRYVLAEGEATGHAHAVREAANVVLVTDVDGNLWLSVKGRNATIEHEEHSHIEVLPGTYKVVRQCEYSPQEIRRVAD